jgi:hypothetical protein
VHRRKCNLGKTINSVETSSTPFAADNYKSSMDGGDDFRVSKTPVNPTKMKAALVVTYVFMLAMNGVQNSGAGALKVGSMTPRSVLSTVACLAFAIKHSLLSLFVHQGHTNGDVSKKHPTSFTPNSWAFTIWGPIFIAVAAMIIYMCASQHSSERESYLSRLWLPLTVNLVVVGLWGVAFAFVIDLSIVLMLVVLATLLVCYYRINVLPHPAEPASAYTHFFFVEFPISIYLGWICVATLANFSIFFDNLGWTQTPACADVMMSLATVASFYFVVRHRDATIACVFAWAHAAIADKQHNQFAWVLCGVNAGLTVMATLARLRNKDFW